MRNLQKQSIPTHKSFPLFADLTHCNKLNNKKKLRFAGRREKRGCGFFVFLLQQSSSTKRRLGLRSLYRWLWYVGVGCDIKAYIALVWRALFSPGVTYGGRWNHAIADQSMPEGSPLSVCNTFGVHCLKSSSKIHCTEAFYCCRWACSQRSNELCGLPTLHYAFFQGGREAGQLLHKQRGARNAMPRRPSSATDLVTNFWGKFPERSFVPLLGTTAHGTAHTVKDGS
jgi:hypothetical protein